MSIQTHRPLRTDRATRATRVAYLAQQGVLLTQCLGIHTAVPGLRPPAGTPADPAQLSAVRARLSALFRRDLDNVEAGHYPRSLLFGMPLATYARRLPRLLRDLSTLGERRRTRHWRLSHAPDTLERYPPYFRRAFHWQVDGYLSTRSAKLYDVGVELLFLGAADVMRRMNLPPIVREAQLQGRRLRVLDVACGTGRTLGQLATALPDADYTGTDLSGFYLQEARRQLAHLPNLSLLVANAEALPLPDGHFDVVTSTYLFHELPADARRRVMAELARVTRPGGLVVLQDSAQLSESRDIDTLLRAFPLSYHEPFYANYLSDPLEAIAASAGLSVHSVAPHYVAKVVEARR